MPVRPSSKKTASKTASKKAAAATLLAWYDVHRRTLPWRAKPGARADPYRVWLSEIMLQQTTVVAVASYYREFLRRWPDVNALAAAPLDDVLAAWAGLGYYARARNLHRAAKMVVDEFGGKFPRTAAELRKLPGVGAYTAGAIAAIAFDAREGAVDANAERVLARIFAVEELMPKAKVRLRALGQSLVPEKRAGDFAQALMDLGSAICTPKRPTCSACPWTNGCEARKRGIQEMLPVKGEKAARPLKRGAAFVARDAKSTVLLVKRPENGLLGGMLQPPLGPWSESFPSPKEALVQAPFRAAWKKRAGIVRHGFTHFELEIEVYVADVGFPSPFTGQVSRAKRVTEGVSARDSPPSAASGGRSPRKLGRKPKGDVSRPPAMTSLVWIAQNELSRAALPTVMRKIIVHALDEGGPQFAQARSARIC
jgi:A/G-specific adenine glycosylase